MPPIQVRPASSTSSSRTNPTLNSHTQTDGNAGHTLSNHEQSRRDSNMQMEQVDSGSGSELQHQAKVNVLCADDSGAGDPDCEEPHGPDQPSVPAPNLTLTALPESPDQPKTHILPAPDLTADQSSQPVQLKAPAIIRKPTLFS
jgi:hypothetical protein